MRRIVLAYSGSAATSTAVEWLVGQGYEVVTLTLDVGQPGDLVGLRERALALGAVRAHVLDAREAFVRDFGIPALQAGVLAGTGKPVSAALARGLLASRLVELARMEGASALAHAAEPATGAAGALSTELASLAPGLDIISVRTAWDLPPDAISDSRWSRVPQGTIRSQVNLFGRVARSDGEGFPETGFVLTRSAASAPSGAAVLEIEFRAGVPVTTNGVEMTPLELLDSLDTIGGVHGVGRAIIGDGTVAIEAPAAAILQLAHRTLETQVLDAELVALKGELSRHYADAALTGRWHSDTRRAIEAFVSVLQGRLNGVVRLELLRGACTVISCESAAARPAGVVA